MKIDILAFFFRKSVEKILVAFKSDKNKGYLHEDRCTYTCMIISRSVLLRMRKFSDKSCKENQNTHFIFNNFVPPPFPPKTMPFVR